MLTGVNIVDSTTSTLQNSGTRPAYTMLRKRLSLILDNVDEQCPADIAYVHSVYAPLSVSFPLF